MYTSLYELGGKCLKGQMSGSPRSSSNGLDQVADKGFMSYPLGIVWLGECFQFDLAFINYPLLKKKKKNHNPKFFEWSSREVSPELNSHSLFEAH